MRIRVRGVSGSGKSRLARAAAERLGVAHLELDAVFWDRDWTYRDADEARALVRSFVEEHPDGWVVEGGWTSRMDGLLEPGTPDGADVVVWLDHPRWLVMSRSVRRTIGRGIRRTELWHGNREDPRGWFSLDPERNVMRWAWTQHPVNRAALRDALAAGEPVVRLSGQRAVDRWLASLP